MANSGTLPFTFTAWLSVWDIVYDWLLESIIGSYSAFMLTWVTLVVFYVKILFGWRLFDVMLVYCFALHC